jgi:hypothetical protein
MFHVEHRAIAPHQVRAPYVGLSRRPAGVNITTERVSPRVTWCNVIIFLGLWVL